MQKSKVKIAGGSSFLYFDFLFTTLLYILPLILYFSYYPIIPLGGNDTMNFELSLPLVWLVMFDVVGTVIAFREKIIKKMWQKSGWRKWLWMLFPLWVSLSIIWSLNIVRGILTAGIMWLIYLAILLMVTVIPVVVKDSVRFRQVFLKWFFASTLFVCGWCFLQCVMDVMGVPQDCTLMCNGCTFEMFGFPHPNGFAIEPQFMGNLLLAPVITIIWLLQRKQNSNNLGQCFLDPKLLLSCFFITPIALFLTFSRGAIYAFAVALIFMAAFVLVRAKKGKERKSVLRRSGIMWGVVVLAFLFALNLQGVFAQVAPTSDNYGDGVAKVVNHLSLGTIEVRGEDEDDLLVENSVENLNSSRGEGAELSGDEKFEEQTKEPVFDGYVAESTDTRVRLTNAALTVWSQDFKTAMIGVGIGGAGQALYNNGLSQTPKEIVQNEYASLLLEIGTVGVVLFVLTIILVVRLFMKSAEVGLFLTLVIAYGVALCFFSGLANALQIYLMPAVLYMVFRKKLVS